MPDLDAIRARHFPSLTDDGDRCRDEGDLWPCDTAIVLEAHDMLRDSIYFDDTRDNFAIDQIDMNKYRERYGY